MLNGGFFIFQEKNMETFKIIQNGDDYLLPVYNRQKIVLMRGEGVNVYDSERTVYLDFFSGIAVNGLGQACPEVVNAIIEETKKLGHVSNYYYNEPNVKLAKLLCEISFAQKVFFCNSGAEAIEAALKLARKYHRRQGQDKHEVISFHRSFHGRTFGAISATGQVKYQEGLDPLLPGFKFATFNNIESVKKLMTVKTGAILVEVIQCEGGIHPADQKFLKDLRDLTRESGILLIFDEVQTGLGRTGKMWAYEHYGVEPDMMTSAKALGGGLPMGALLVTNQAAQGFQAGDHASTFGGNPIVSAAAIANIETIIMKDLVAQAAKLGEYLRAKLEAIQKEFPKLFTEVRGMGLIQGLEMTKNASSLVANCAKQGLLVGSAHENVLRFLPPLIITPADIDKALNRLRAALADELKAS
jgi:predicted acetylornithine/succinylornithine family transaminase